MSRFESRLDKNGGTFLGGGRVTVADLRFYVLLKIITFRLADGTPEGALDKYVYPPSHRGRFLKLIYLFRHPKLKEWFAKFSERAPVAAHYAKRAAATKK